jgi:hypothetical protein
MFLPSLLMLLLPGDVAVMVLGGWWCEIVLVVVRCWVML